MSAPTTRPPAPAVHPLPATDQDAPSWHPDRPARLARLEQRVREDLAATASRTDWIPGAADELDVLIVGGGQAGLGSAFALRRSGIGRVLVIDDQPADRVGCWDRYARMPTLRSPKHMRGIEFDVPSLHVRRWFEAVYGEEAWQSINLIPRLDWHDYLRWYRDITATPIRHHARVTAVHRPSTPDGPFLVDVVSTGGEPEQPALPQQYAARRVVFAAGLDGAGRTFVPEMISALPSRFWQHTQDDIDPATFAGKRVAVLGAGASGFDNAATALEAGAVRADVFQRRADVPRHQPLRWMEFPGMQQHFFELGDEQKWEFTQYNATLPQPPTQHTIWRCFGRPGFDLHRGTVWNDVRVAGDELVIDTTAGEFRADLIISATGYALDLTARPELTEFIDDIQRWDDVHPPAAGHPLGASPYLGSGFEFTARDPHHAPWLNRLHHLSGGARPSMGITGNQLSGIHGALNRLAAAIAAAVTRENWPALFEDFRGFRSTEVSTVGPHTDSDGWYPTAHRWQPRGTPLSLAEFNALRPVDALGVVGRWADVPRWATEIVADRPYPSVSELYAAADRLARGWTDDEVDAALADHPRIGERSSGRSAVEQSGVADAEPWLAANREYEQRFGRIFLISAARRTGAELLAALHARLGNDDATEARVRADELRRIALLRLTAAVTR